LVEDFAVNIPAQFSRPVDIYPVPNPPVDDRLFFPFAQRYAAFEKPLYFQALQYLCSIIE